MTFAVQMRSSCFPPAWFGLLLNRYGGGLAGASRGVTIPIDILDGSQCFPVFGLLKDREQLPGEAHYFSIPVEFEFVDSLL
jgi:hypothetical protein